MDWSNRGRSVREILMPRTMSTIPLLLQSIQNGGGATLGQSVPKSEDKEDSE
mgnify:CR=1 FL=1